MPLVLFRAVKLETNLDRWLASPTLTPSPPLPVSMPRFQKLRKKAGLMVGDLVEAFYHPLGPGGDLLSGMLESHQAYLLETLGRPLLPLSSKARHSVRGGTLCNCEAARCSLHKPHWPPPRLPTALQVIIATEDTTVGTAEDGTLAAFTAVLAVPSCSFDGPALRAAAGGDSDLANSVEVFLACR